MIDDDDMDHLQFRVVPESVEDEFAKTVRVRVAARRAFIEVDTDSRLRVALSRKTRPGRLIFKLESPCRIIRRRARGVATTRRLLGGPHGSNMVIVKYVIIF